MVRGFFTRFLIYCTFSQVVECISLYFTAEEVISSRLLSGAGSIPPPNHVHTFRSSVNIISYICNGCIRSVHYLSHSLSCRHTGQIRNIYCLFVSISFSFSFPLEPVNGGPAHAWIYTLWNSRPPRHTAAQTQKIEITNRLNSPWHVCELSPSVALPFPL